MLLDSNIIIYACQPGCVQLYDGLLLLNPLEMMG